MSHIVHEYLGNGIEVLLCENHFSRAVAIQTWVRAGSTHEEADEQGMAHYLEHMLFKGTARRAVGEIAATVESCGGDINAYTTFDRTVFYLTLASKHANLGVDLLADAIFNSSFDREEFEREREVILEEIRRGQDDPGSVVGRRVFSLAYPDTQVGRPIIGSEESVRAFTRDKVVAFHDKWYRPRNISVVVVGDFDADAMRDTVRKTFGLAKDRKLPEKKADVPRTVANRALGSSNVELIFGDWKQPRLELVFAGPPLEHHDTAALDLAAFALGAGDLSRLNRRLRDQEGLITGASASLFSPAFPGIFEVSVFGPVENWLDSVRATARELAAVCHHEPVTEVEIDRARASLRSDRIYRDETVEGQARNLGFGLTTTHKQLFDDVYWATVSGTTATGVYHACQRWLDPAGVRVVGMLPTGTAITEVDVRKALENGFRDGTGAKSDSSIKPTTMRSHSTSEAEVVDLKPGLRLVYKRNPEAKLFSLVAASEGGLRAEGDSDAGVFNAMSGLSARASRDYSYEALVTAVEDLGASLDGFSGKDSFGMQFHCLSGQVERLVELFGSTFVRPVFPTDQWGSLQREIIESLENQDDSPAGMCIRRFQEMVFGAHPYRYPLSGRIDNVRGWNAAALTERWERERDRNPWIIGAVGALELDQVKSLLNEHLRGWTPASSVQPFASANQIKMASAASARLTKAREQTHITFGFRGLTWDDSDRAVLDVLTTILGGHGGRLFLRLRDRDGLAYSVSPVVSHGKHPGVVGSYIACAPTKAGQALASLEREMYALCETPVESAELERAKNYIVGSHEMDLQRGDAQAMTMALMELYGIGYDDFRTYPGRVERVSAADIQRVARRLFDKSSAISVQVGPE